MMQLNPKKNEQDFVQKYNLMVEKQVGWKIQAQLRSFSMPELCRVNAMNCNRKDSWQECHSVLISHLNFTSTIM